MIVTSRGTEETFDMVFSIMEKTITAAASTSRGTVIQKNHAPNASHRHVSSSREWQIAMPESPCKSTASFACAP